MNGSCLWVICTVYQATNAGVDQGSRTHRARFNCSKQVALSETVITQVRACFAQRDDLGMSGWIAVRKVAIPPAADNTTTVHDYRPHGHLSDLQCSLGRAQCLFHP